MNTNRKYYFTIFRIVTYGTVNHTSTDDGDQGYVMINGVDVVGQIRGTIDSNYVEKISFAFFTTPTTSKPAIWLYVMNRTGSTAIFTPHIIYQTPYSLIRVGATGIQTITLPSNALPITQGQYIGVGFDSSGGSCYRASNRNEYYLNTYKFSTLSAATYSYSSAAGFAFSFVVRTIGYISN